MGTGTSSSDRLPIALLLFAVLTVLVSIVAPAPAAAWLLAAGAAILPSALVLLAVRARPRAGQLRGVVVALGLLLAAALGGILVLSAVGPDTGRWLGMPPGMALLVVGLWLAPFPLVALAYILTFDGRQRSGAADGRRR